MIVRWLYLVTFVAASVGLVAQTTSPPLYNAFEHDTDSDGVVDEFDDYPADATYTFETHDPERSGSGRIAFEVDWPHRGDNDFNDLVLSYHFARVTNAINAVVQLIVEVQIVAIGTDTPVGIAVRLPLPKGTIVKAALGRDGGVPRTVFPEGGTSETVYRLFENALATRDSTSWMNTTRGEPWIDGESFELRVTVATGLASSELGPEPFDLFLFHTKEPGREIHRPNARPTELADFTLFQTYADTTDPVSGRSYLSDEGLPWAVDLPGNWRHPCEQIDLARAYPRVVDWIESGGSAEIDWFSHPETSAVLP